MNKIFKSAIGLAIGGLCGCGATNDGTPQGGTAKQAPVGVEASPLGSLLTGVTQGYRGDFNNDGNEDTIIVTSLGSFEYTGLTGGGFGSGAWSNGATLNNVNYTVGDFNGDGASDFIMTTASGSAEYLGKTSGGFTVTSFSHPEWTLNNVDFYPGDFDGDGTTDMIVVTSANSVEWKGVRSVAGGFTNAWTFSAGLTHGNVKYTTGNFNGDAYSDLIATTASGSSEYLGRAGSGFNVKTWADGSKFPLNLSLLWAGDFNGDGSWDLIAQNDDASYQYNGFSGVNGGFTGAVMTRTDLSRMDSDTDYFPGDFNGDGKWDVFITTQTGGYLYLGAAGQYSPIFGHVWSNPDMVSYQDSFYAGKFTGNGKPTDLIVLSPDDSTEYLGNPGTTTGGFTASSWVRTDLPVRSVGYY